MMEEVEQQQLDAIQHNQPVDIQDKDTISEVEQNKNHNYEDSDDGGILGRASGDDDAEVDGLSEGRKGEEGRLYDP